MRRRPTEPRSARRRVRPRLHTGRLVAGAFVAAALAVTLLLTAFGTAEQTRVTGAAVAPAKRLLPARPLPQVIAVRGALRIELPIAQSRVTAIGYHAASTGGLALDPVGRPANEGLLSRLAHRLFGGGGGGLRYYQLGGSGGADTAVLNVGAPPGTDVYAPVDGTVVGISDYIVSGGKYGVRIDIQPAGAPSLVVSLTHLRPDPALEIGSSVASTVSKIGTVLDLSRVEEQALARYTQDEGNHVALEVRPAATLSP
ncbi:MAG: hypothetical protein ICV59_00050 [Thermoleophilia bacterium]|nr:hypothetical protein [Thermoleophilia bacterium]